MAHNYRGTLSQFAQRNRARAPKLPEFIDLGSTGFQLNKIYHVKCEFIVDGRLLTTTASARKKKLAFRDSARRMLEKLERLPKPEAERLAMGDCKTGEFLIGMKVRAKWNDTERFYDGVVAKKNDDNTYNIFWPQWRNQTENIKAADIQRQKIRIYKKGRLRVRDGKAGIDVTCQPKGIVITNKGDQPDMEVNDTLVAINDNNLKGLMPDKQAEVWKENLLNAAEFIIERPRVFKPRAPLIPQGDSQAIYFYWKKNRHLLKKPATFNMIYEDKFAPRFTMECILEYKDDRVIRVEASARAKKEVKKLVAKKMVERMSDELKDYLEPTKRKATSAPTSQPPAKRVKTETSSKGKPHHEMLQEKAEKAYEDYLKLANEGNQDRATKMYKLYESTYKQYADEYREYAAKES